MELSTKKSIYILIICCITVRMILFLLVGPWNADIVKNNILQTHSDEMGYNNLAISLLHGNFSLYGNTEALRTPLYPAFIGLFYFLFGKLIWIVLLAQIFVDSLSCLVLFLAIKELINPSVGFYSALFYVLNPFLMMRSVTLMSDTLFIFFCILFYYFFIKVFLLRSTKYVILSALFLGLATLTRPISIYLPLLIILFFVLIHKRDFKKAIKLSIFFCLVFLLSLSPWIIRNYLAFNEIFFSTSGSYNLLMLYVVPMEVERRNQPTAVVENILKDEVDSLIISKGLNPSNLNNYQKENYFKEIAINYIKKSPFTFVKYHVLGITHTIIGLGTREFATLLNIHTSQKIFNIQGENNIFKLIAQFFKQKTIGEIVLGLFFGIYLFVGYLLLLIGVYSIKKYNHKSFLIFSLIIAAYFLILTGAAGQARFRLPSIPFYICFVGIGFYNFTLILKNRKNISLKENFKFLKS